MKLVEWNDSFSAGKPVALLNASGVASQVMEVANFSKIFTIKSAF